jgi:hypothetical protein
MQAEQLLNKDKSSTNSTTSSKLSSSNVISNTTNAGDYEKKSGAMKKLNLLRKNDGPK